MRKLLALVILCLPFSPLATAQNCPLGFTCVPVGNTGLTAQVPAPIVQIATPAIASAITSASKITYSPDMLVSAGGGYASPNGKFGYYSVSKSVGQNTYATMANQYTIVGGKLESCALAGLTKEMYQFGPLVLGLTGLGGGCEGFSGNAGAAGSAQAFAHIHFGKSPIGLAITGMKTTSPGFQTTIAPTWGK